MFDSPGPRLFALPPGADFPAGVAAGLEARLKGAPPETWARVTMFANSGRMVRQLKTALHQGTPKLLPRIRALADLDAAAGFPEIPPARSGLSLTLDLARLVDRLILADPTLAPRSAVFGLAESLAALLDEFHGEGVSPAALAALDVETHAEHWARSRAIVLAALEHFAQDPSLLPGAESRRGAIISDMISRWRVDPPQDPVLVAGSTGSRGATRRLMEAVALLPQGALILPGFDTDQPLDLWRRQGGAMAAEDHPQFRFLDLMDALGTDPGDVRPWAAQTAPDPARNRLVSLALRPAPVTDVWREEGPALGDPARLTEGMALLEAPGARDEAVAIALRLRQAAQDGQRAALVTPDRALTRRVTSALDRWGILPDDSAGIPLHLTPPARLLRHVARWQAEPPGLAPLIALLKHPLVASGTGRGPHMRNSSELEIWLREHRVAQPDPAILSRGIDADRAAWRDWLLTALFQPALPERAPLPDRLSRLIAATEDLARGPDPNAPSALWDEAPGEETRQAMAALQEAAPESPDLTAMDLVRLLDQHLSSKALRDQRALHPDIMIWGTLEARGMGADLVILAGLNEGTWPEAPSADPWLNRQMRAEIGLLSPDRRIGLSAHDFQQAIGARQVLLSRARSVDGAETVASRWLNRLTNLLAGLGAPGAAALARMTSEGQRLLAQAEALDRPRPEEIAPPAPRPAPRPPVSARPKSLSVTAVTRLRRDPYAIYARHILDLKPLDPLRPIAAAPERGIALHKVMETFVKQREDWLDDPEEARRRLGEITKAELALWVPDPGQRAIWEAGFLGVADRIIDGEIERLGLGTPMVLEEGGGQTLAGLDFRLTARPDRIDRLTDGSYAVYDYKTGTPPNAAKVAAFERQLPLTAALIERDGFKELVPGPVTRMAYIGLGRGAKELNPIELETKEGVHLPSQAWEDLTRLIARFNQRRTGYGSRISVEKVDFAGEYDHLARFGEWTHANAAEPSDVGPDEP